MRDTEDHIQRALQIGEKNQQIIKLVQNWCANVSVKVWGGVGLVEAQTGLPIGTRCLECPHAAASGMAGMDLEMVAIDFYDRNCADCKLRKPVGLPNLKSLVDRRDEERARQEQARRGAEQQVSDRIAAREASRQELRKRLDTLPATTLDQISELDRSRDKEAGARLVQIAELAPETFTAEIIEALFGLIESKDHWLIEPCLAALALLPVDKQRLCNTALRALPAYSAREVSAKIIERDCQHADQNLICGALPHLVRLANPAPSRFGLGPDRIVPLPGPLKAAYAIHATAIKGGLKLLLEQKDVRSVRFAARGLEFLSRSDVGLLSFLVSELTAKLARSKWLVYGEEQEVEDAIHDIRRAVTRSFMASPHQTDAIIQSYLTGATPEGAHELHHVYRDVLRGERRAYGEELKITDAHRIAFRRLVAAAVQSENEEVAQTGQEVFRGAPYELTPLANEEIDLLLGHAAIVTHKIKEFEESPKGTANDFLSTLERMNKRNALSSLEDSFIEWACTAAGRYGAKSIEKVISVLEGLPDGTDSLKASMIRHFDKMMVSAEGLTLCLPHYYTALVGPSQLVRARAAEALGEMRSRVREDLPNLVFEAFAALLTDSYVIVHRAAVKALGRFRLPADFDVVAKDALRALINHYAPRSKQDSSKAKFVLETIDLYANRYATEAQRAGRLGEQILSILTTLRPYDVAQEMRHAGRSLRGNPNYGKLLFKLLADEQAMSTYHEDLIEQIESVPKKFIYEARVEAANIAKTMGQQYRELPGVLIEALTDAGAWIKAEEVCTALLNTIDSSTRMKPARLHAALRKIACSYETAIANGHVEALETLASDWKETLKEIENDQEANKKRRDPLFGVFGSH
jgi:hypothetical protein